MKEKKGGFSGSIGFVLAAAGSAVGVWNIWLLGASTRLSNWGQRIEKHALNYRSENRNRPQKSGNTSNIKVLFRFMRPDVYKT